MANKSDDKHYYQFNPEGWIDRTKLSYYFVLASILAALFFNLYIWGKGEATKESSLLNVVQAAGLSWIIYASIYQLVDNRVWKFGLIKKASFFYEWFVKFPPDISGEYQLSAGWYKPKTENDNEEEGNAIGYLKIGQTLEKIFIYGDFEDLENTRDKNKRFRSTMASLKVLEGGDLELFFTYIFEYIRLPDKTKEDNKTIEAIHKKGTATIRLEKEKGKWIGTGSYYHNDRGTGLISVVEVK